MDLFKSGLKTMLGTNGGSDKEHPNDPHVTIETIEKLNDRLGTSTLIEDKRDAGRALKSLSKPYRVGVGTKCLDALVKTLESEDTELISYGVDALVNITSSDFFENEDVQNENLGVQFSEIMCKNGQNIHKVLDVLEEYDFRVRLSAIKLLRNLAQNCKLVQDHILHAKNGVGKIIDLMSSDPREVIRNEAILLLTALSKNNANIQKIITFENGFDQILKVIRLEGYSDGGPVVEDCLILMLNLLSANTSNVIFFKEGAYINSLLPYFTPESSNSMSGWPMQKMMNMSLMLKVLRCLVNPLNSSQAIIACQTAIKDTGILNCLQQMFLAGGIPAETLEDCIITVAEIIRGHQVNQDSFGDVSYEVESNGSPESKEQRSLIKLLLQSLFNERQALSLRLAVLYCVQSFLFNNEVNQASFVKSLLPTSASDSRTVSMGQVICKGLFSKDFTNNWFASAVMSSAVLDNLAQKNNLTKMQATNAGEPPVGIMEIVIGALRNSATKTEVKIGLMQFLSIWMEGASGVVGIFLENSHAIPYLISQITATFLEEKEKILQGLSAYLILLSYFHNPNTITKYDKATLNSLLKNRIGLETLAALLNNVSKSEEYSQTIQHPQPKTKVSSQLTFHYSFCQSFKKNESIFLVQLTDPVLNDVTKENIEEYKNIILKQDQEIQSLRNHILMLKSSNEQHASQMKELENEVFQLKNQLALAEAQRATNNVSETEELAEKNKIIVDLEQRVQQLLKLNYDSPTSTNGASSSGVKIRDEFLVQRLEEENKSLLEEIEKLKTEQEGLLELMCEQDNKIAMMTGTPEMQNGNHNAAVDPQ